MIGGDGWTMPLRYNHGKYIYIYIGQNSEKQRPKRERERECVKGAVNEESGMGPTKL